MSSSPSLKEVVGKDSENSSNSSNEGGGNNSDNSALVSLGNASFGFNFESDGGFNSGVAEVEAEAIPRTKETAIRAKRQRRMPRLEWPPKLLELLHLPPLDPRLRLPPNPKPLNHKRHERNPKIQQTHKRNQPRMLRLP